MEPRLLRNCTGWLTSKADGWWYCYEDMRAPGMVSRLYGPFGSEGLAWGDARSRIEGRGRPSILPAALGFEA